MGSRGPAPTPTAILAARGSWRAKARAGELAAPVEIPEAPAWLSTEAKAEWARQCKELARIGCIALIDRPFLAAYCEAWGEFVAVCWDISELTKTNRAQGYALAISAGLINAKNRAVERLVKLGAQFGFSPAARTRLQVPGREEKKTGVAGFARDRGRGDDN